MLQWPHHILGTVHCHHPCTIGGIPIIVCCTCRLNILPNLYIIHYN